MNSNSTILFDGVCNLCNGAVTFVIKRDKKSQIKFAALQSETGQRLLKQFNLSANIFNSFIFIEDGIAYTQSTAALKVCKYLTAMWPLLYGFIIVPPFIRNLFYNFIAVNRYSWFGKKEECMIPGPEILNRFID